MYGRFFKRGIDLVLSLSAVIMLSPFLIFLTLIGCIKMKGNPFFTQLRPGKDGKIFRLIKFKSMTEEKDRFGRLLPDEKRLTSYGKFIRKTSLDELPELLNIVKGDMAIVGPRPLLVKYLTLYNETQMRRHEVRPGLTGLAQINGRNATTWEKRFSFDIYYVENLSFLLDLKIIISTIGKVLKKEGISGEESATMEEFKGNDT